MSGRETAVRRAYRGSSDPTIICRHGHDMTEILLTITSDHKQTNKPMVSVKSYFISERFGSPISYDAALLHVSSLDSGRLSEKLCGVVTVK